MAIDSLAALGNCQWTELIGLLVSAGQVGGPAARAVASPADKERQPGARSPPRADAQDQPWKFLATCSQLTMFQKASTYLGRALR